MGRGLRAGESGAAASRRLILAGLLLLALVFRAAVPAGWMPSADGASLVICTGTGPAVVHLDGKGEPTKPRTADRHDVCAFAGLGAAPPEPPAVLTAPSQTAQIARLDAGYETTARLPPRHRDQAARAPPALI